MRTLLACLLFLVTGLGWTVDTSGPAATPPATKVAYIPIKTDIAPLTARYLNRTLDDAKRLGATTVVVHITSPGGRVDTTMEMTSALLAIPKDGPQLVAFIDEHAISAAALIAYCHQRIYMTPRASIGDIGVIFQTPEGKIEYAPEKFETVVRGMLRNAAQNRGWNEAKLSKMTARNQELWRVDLGQGPEWIIGDDLPAFLTKHPEIEMKDQHLVRDKTRVGEVVSGKDRLLLYTAKEAVDEKMATALVDDLDALYQQLGTSKTQVVDLSPSTTESVSWVLAGWAPLLAGLAVLFLILEFKMPGGLFISLAAVAGTAFFICQFYQDLASYIEVILVVVGLIAVILDVFVLPTGGWLASLGLMSMASGLVLSFMPNIQQFDPSTEGWGGQLLAAFTSSIFALAVMAAGLVVAISSAPKLKAMRRISVEAAIDATATAAPAPGALVGRRGIARTGLSPAGFVTVDGQELSASSEHGEFVAPGTGIEIVEVRFGEAVVRPVAGGPS
jgi:membrane-bound serine protease (ClpP class)